MRILPFLVLSALLPGSFSAFSAETIEVPGGKKVSLSFIKEKEKEARVEVTVEGKLRQTFSHLGGGFRMIGFKGKSAKYASADIDGDGNLELLFRTSQDPLVGSLWLLRWEPEKNAFAMEKVTERGDFYLPVPLEGPILVSEKGEVTFLMPDGKTKISHRWDGKKFLRK